MPIHTIVRRILDAAGDTRAVRGADDRAVLAEVGVVAVTGQAEIRGPESRGVAARTRPEHGDLGPDVSHAGSAAKRATPGGVWLSAALQLKPGLAAA